jgi:predicted XRE-type DNA-binding protein
MDMQAPWVEKYGLQHPYGECQCGCGGKAPLADQGDSKWGYMKGEPRRFIMNHHRTAPTLEDAFWPNVQKGDGCWEWTGSKNVWGYGRIKIRRKVHMAHKVAYTLHYGPIPDGLVICHRCDNRGCVNPAHLFIGTYADNSADMVSKGRQARGERNANAKLTEAVVREMRQLYASGMKQDALAARFNISQMTVSDVIRRRTWRHIP